MCIRDRYSTVRSGATSKTKPSAAGSKSTSISANCGAQFCFWCSTDTPRIGYGGNRDSADVMPERYPLRWPQSARTAVPRFVRAVTAGVGRVIRRMPRE